MRKCYIKYLVGGSYSNNDNNYLPEGLNTQPSLFTFSIKICKYFCQWTSNYGFSLLSESSPSTQIEVSACLCHWILCLSVLSWAAIMKYRRLGGLNNRNLFLTALEAGKSRYKVLATSGPQWGLCSCLADGPLLPMSSHGGERESSDFSFHKGTDPPMRAPLYDII